MEKTCTVWLRLQLSALTEEDSVVVRLNGNVVGDAAPIGVLSAEPGPAGVALEVDPTVVKKGCNIVEVKRTFQRDLAAMPMIDRLVLTVRYKLCLPLSVNSRLNVGPHVVMFRTDRCPYLPVNTNLSARIQQPVNGRPMDQ